MEIKYPNKPTVTTQTNIKCLQINLQHSRAATANLIRIVTEEEINIIFIQERYTIQGKVIGIPTKYTTFTARGVRPRAAVVVTSKVIDTTTISQLTDMDTVTVEVIKDNLNLNAASMYFDREQPMEKDMEKMERLLLHAKNTGVLIAADTNARSALWYDRVTNDRGRILEEFMTTNHLFFLNEECGDTTFCKCKGKSNIDLTIVNPQLLRSITSWQIGSQESLSDHRIIKFEIKPTPTRLIAANPLL
jgi:hypothetical protein